MSSEYKHFCVLGPGKAGSTWFYNVMRYHRNVAVPRIKETYFFSENFSEGRSWYENMFNYNENTKLFGDFSNQNIFMENVIDNCETIYPNTTYFIFIRDPLSRLVSSYLFEKQIGFTGSLFDFVDFIGGVERFDNNEIINSVVSKYKNISLYIIDFNDIAKRPQELLDDICKVMNIPSVNLDGCDFDKNPSLKPRLSILSRFGKAVSSLLRNLGLYMLLQTLKDSKYVKNIFYTNTKAIISENDLVSAESLITESFYYKGKFGFLEK